MIPQYVSETLMAKFPGVKLHYREDMFVRGFAVDWHGVRNGWIIKSDDQWDRVLEMAVEWLARHTSPQ